MRSRLLTPFVSALAGSLFVLLAMFVWSGMRQPGEQLLLLEPTVAEANTETGNGVTLTWTSSAPTTLGQETVFTASVEITSTTEYTMTWDYNINTPMINVTTGVLTGPVSLTSGVDTDPYFYRSPGTYTAVATVYVDGQVAVQNSIEVTVNGPSIALASTPADPLFGDVVSFTITINDFDPATVSEVQLNYGGLGPDPDVFTSFSVGGEGEVVLQGTQTVTLTEAGAFTPTASIVAVPPYAIDTTATVAINVNPALALVADPTTVGIGEDVAFTATPSGISAGALSVASVTFNFGDGNSAADDAAPFATTYAYTAAGTFPTSATLTFAGDVYGGGISSSSVDVTVTGGESTFALVGPATLTAGQNPTSGVITATLSPAAVAPVSFAITSNTGATVTPTAGETDASGVFTATVAAGSTAGDIVVVATSGALTATTTIASVLDGSTATTPLVSGANELTVNIPGVGSRPFVLTLSGNITQPTGLVLSIKGLPTTGTISPSAPITPTDPITPPTTTQNLFLAQAGVTSVPAQTSSGEITMYGFNVEIFPAGSATPISNEALVAFLTSVNGSATISTTYQASDLIKSTGTATETVSIIPTTVGLFELDQSPDVFSRMVGSTSNPSTR
ncbi:MAG: hypothetical protein HC911_13970, partial [Chloroflexaceae bacterium]|nr:hypothetical protein [Chloroflexaceae bacterium]